MNCANCENTQSRLLLQIHSTHHCAQSTCRPAAIFLTPCGRRVQTNVPAPNVPYISKLQLVDAASRTEKWKNHRDVRKKKPTENLAAGTSRRRRNQLNVAFVFYLIFLFVFCVHL